MKILITGSTGLLGQALVRRLAPSTDVVGVSRRPPPTAHESGAGHEVCDLTEPEATAQAVRRIDPDVVIHAQALSDVDRCEQQPELAERLNVRTLQHLCHALEQARQPLLLAFSSDYVFDGLKTSPYTEADEPRPLSVYGRSKVEGERLVLRYARGIVLRTSTLFGPGRANFCSTIVKRLRQGQPVEAFLDQTTSPTYTEDVARCLHELIGMLTDAPTSQPPRVYHLANAGGCSRVELAQAVAALLGAPASLVQPILMAAQQRPARRPAYTRLDSRHLPPRAKACLRPWPDALHAYLAHQGWLN